MRDLGALGYFLDRFDLLRFRLFRRLRVMRINGCRNGGRTRDSERETSSHNGTDKPHVKPFQQPEKIWQALRVGIDLDQIFGRSKY